MTNIAIVDTAPKAVQSLFDFVLHKNVNAHNIKTMSKSFAKNEVGELNKVAFSSELQGFSFYNISLYNKKGINDDELISLIVTLSDFKSEVINFLLGVKKFDYKKKGKLERRVSPPIEAYKYIGNNKTDIKYSDKSFGLLFE